MYVEFGASATDSITLQHTLDATQKSYNFAGSQILQSQNYNNCMRQEMGYCRIQWQQNAATSPDPFQLDTDTTGSANAAGGIVPANPTPTAAIAYPCLIAYVKIPDGSLDGITAFPSGLRDNAFHSWGLDGYSRTGVRTCSVRVQSGLHPATLLSPQRDLSKKLNN